MADIVRKVEFADLVGTHKRAELGRGRRQWGAYIDTGATRTVVSARVARSVRMIEAPFQIDYVVPIKVPAKAFYTGMRLLLDGCDELQPMLIAVSDEVIGALDLPDVEVLIGQDYLQAARIRMDLAPRGEAQRLSCRTGERRSWNGSRSLGQLEKQEEEDR